MELLLFILYSVALLGQTADSYTTRIGLDHGFREANPVMRWLIARIGFGLAQFIKCGVVPLLFIPVDVIAGGGSALAYLVVMAVGGWWPAVCNYRRLRRAGISVKWFGA